jgi:hypothetical protein
MPDLVARSLATRTAGSSARRGGRRSAVTSGCEARASGAARAAGGRRPGRDGPANQPSDTS